MDEDPANARSPEGARFVREVMRIVGAERPADLVRMLGGKWLARDQERKVYKWHRGDSAPNFEGTVALLTLAGLLTENPVPGVSPRAVTLADLDELMRAGRRDQHEQWADLRELAGVVKRLASGVDALRELVESALSPPDSGRERRLGGL